ncbi:MAG: putative fructose-bisphosphate aldolase [Firmicutes bacterium ADurb.Bin506]|nr:MAG: putative fructose-bisphosphate aldolase [Firmicutes bacterium ADurb.Bin506]
MLTMGPYTLVEILNMMPPGRAAAAFNFSFLEDLKGIISAAETENTPVIVQAMSTAVQHAGIEYIAAMGRAAAESARVPVCLQLDHGHDIAMINRAIELGFTSVMIDGSDYPFEDNVRITRQVVDLAHKAGVTVEAELGRILRNDNGPQRPCMSDECLTDPDEAKRFVELTGVDALAPAIGTVHGHYRGYPVIRFDLLQAIAENTRVPLVLHGASGVPHDMIKQSVMMGIRKINVARDICTAHADALKKSLHDVWGANASDMRRTSQAAIDAVRAVALAKIRMLSF